MAAEFDVPDQIVIALVAADAVLLTAAELHGTQRGEVLGILRNLDQIFGFCTFWNRDFALLPHARNICLPRFAHAANEAVRAAEEQHMRAQCMPPRQHAEILQHDSFKQRRHQLVRRRSHFLQTVDVGFREYAALSGHFVQLDAFVFLFGQLDRRNFQLGIDLVDHGAGAARALIVHRRNLLLAPSLIIVLEHDNLRVLPPEFDHRIDLGMELFDSKRDCRDFLHEFRADLLCDAAATGAGHEHASILAIDAHLGFHAFQELEAFLRLLGFVALVVLPKDLVGGRIYDNCLDRSRPDVESNEKLGDVVVRLLRVRDLLHLRPKRNNLNQLRSFVVVHRVLLA